MTYSKTAWTNDSAPYLNQTNLNKIEQGIADAHDFALALVNTQTSSYTAVLSDANKVVEMNVAGANTFTVPPNSAVAYPIGTVIEVFQLGAGQTTITPGAGVTIRFPGSKTKTSGQYATVGLRKRATDEWVLSGDSST